MNIEKVLKEIHESIETTDERKLINCSHSELSFYIDTMAPVVFALKCLGPRYEIVFKDLKDTFAEAIDYRDKTPKG